MLKMFVNFASKHYGMFGFVLFALAHREHPKCTIKYILYITAYVQ